MRIKKTFYLVDIFLTYCTGERGGRSYSIKEKVYTVEIYNLYIVQEGGGCTGYKKRFGAVIKQV